MDNRHITLGVVVALALAMFWPVEVPPVRLPATPIVTSQCDGVGHALADTLEREAMVAQRRGMIGAAAAKMEAAHWLCPVWQSLGEYKDIIRTERRSP